MLENLKDRIYGDLTFVFDCEQEEPYSLYLFKKNKLHKAKSFKHLTELEILLDGMEKEKHPRHLKKKIQDLQSKINMNKKMYRTLERFHQTF